MATPAHAPGTPAVTAEPVPVAFIGRTSTLALQDPRASLNRQLRSARDWLPGGLAGPRWRSVPRMRQGPARPSRRPGPWVLVLAGPLRYLP